MKTLLLSFFCVIGFVAKAQVTLDISGGLSMYDHTNVGVELENAQIESITYNPINGRVSYSVSSFSVGMSFSYYEFINNFDNVYYYDDIFPQYVSYYVNGGFYRSLITSMVYVSIDVWNEGVVSFFSAFGAGHYTNTRVKELTFREVRADLRPNQTFELNGNFGYSSLWTSEIGVRINTPKSWKLGAYFEVLYTANEMGFATSRLGVDDLPAGRASALPNFSNNDIWFRAGLRFPLGSPSVNKEKHTEEDL